MVVVHNHFLNIFLNSRVHFNLIFVNICSFFLHDVQYIMHVRKCKIKLLVMDQEVFNFAVTVVGC